MWLLSLLMGALLGVSAPIAWLAWREELRGPFGGLDDLVFAPAVIGTVVGLVLLTFVFENERKQK